MNANPTARIGVSILTMLLVVMPFMSTLEKPSLAYPIAADDDTETKCKLHCDRQIEKRPAFIEIDANTGEVLNGTTKFAEGEKVQVIISHKNPFKYTYRIQIVAAPLDTIIASAFLKLIPGFGDIVDSIVAGTPLPRGTAGAPGGTSCAGPGNAAWTALYAKAQPLTEKNTSIKADIDPRAEAYKLYEKLYKETDIEMITDCATVCKDAAELDKKIGKLINFGTLAATVEKFKKDVDDLKPLIDAFEAIFNNLTPAQRALCDVKDELDKIKALSSDAEKYQKAVTDLQSHQKAFELMSTMLDKALRTEDGLTTVQYPYTAGGPTGVRITIFRKNLREENAQEKQVTQVDLQVGESPLSISAGIGFSTIRDRRVIRQPFAKADGMIGARFGEENTSKLRPSALVMLNASLRRFNMFAKDDGSFALSTGLVLSNRNGTTEAEFIVGPSIGFLSNRVFVTFGYHAARVEQLGGGFKLGDEIPANITDPLPVERNWKSAFMFGVTYKLR
jgi:hypothetical protein